MLCMYALFQISLDILSIFTLAGAGLGYFLELWGTTRECWTYYTLQTPPLFAVLAHGMAAVAFWRAGLVVKMIGGRIRAGWTRPLDASPERSRRAKEEALAEQNTIMNTALPNPCDSDESY